MATPSINTMTMTAATSLSSVRVMEVFERGAEEAGSAGGALPRVVFATVRSPGGGVMRVGDVVRTNGRVRRFHKPPFDNQATLVVASRFAGAVNSVNVKVFQNGRIQMTGVRSHEQAREVCGHVARIIAPDATVGAYQVHLINAKDHVGAPVDQNRLHQALAREGFACYFDPSIYNGVKVYYMHGAGCGKCPGWRTGLGDESGCRCGACTRVTLLVFAKGSFIVTGAKTPEQVAVAALWLRETARRVMGPALGRGPARAPPPS